MDYTLWLQLITSFATIVARESGAAPRELAYLDAAMSIAKLKTATDSDLEELRLKYEAEVAEDLPTTPDELDEIIQRIEERGKRIQGT